MIHSRLLAWAEELLKGESWCPQEGDVPDADYVLTKLEELAQAIVVASEEKE